MDTLTRDQARSVTDTADVAGLIAAIAAHPGRLTAEDFPLAHHFAPGVYVREIQMPADRIVVGRVHRTDHLNIISQGRVSVWMGGGAVREFVGPCTFRSGAGVQKVLYTHTDTVWSTVHVTDETELAALEALLVMPFSVEAAARLADAEPLLQGATI